jgi:pilus assembly protein Flp/PilA
MLSIFRARLNDETGASLVEYALLLVLIAIVAIVAIGIVGNDVNSAFETVGSSL